MPTVCDRHASGLVETNSLEVLKRGVGHHALPRRAVTSVCESAFLQMQLLGGDFGLRKAGDSHSRSCSPPRLYE